MTDKEYDCNSYDCKQTYSIECEFIMVVCGFLSSQTSIYNPELSVEYTQRRLYKLLGLNSWQWLFMIVSLIQIGTIGGLTYYQFEQNDVLSSSLVIKIII